MQKPLSESRCKGSERGEGSGGVKKGFLSSMALFRDSGHLSEHLRHASNPSVGCDLARGRCGAMPLSSRPGEDGRPVEENMWLEFSANRLFSLG